MELSSHIDIVAIIHFHHRLSLEQRLFLFESVQVVDDNKKGEELFYDFPIFNDASLIKL